MPEVFDERLFADDENVRRSQLQKSSESVEDSGNEKIEGNAAFLRAARSGNFEKALGCLKRGADVNSCNSNGLNALHLAAKEGHEDIVRELIRYGAKANSKTKKGNTALHIAALAGHFEVVKLLVENHAEVNVQSQNGFTPLYMAAQEGHDEIVKFLLANGGNQNLGTDDGYTPLAVALQQGHDRVVSTLLDNDGRGKARLPALHVAAKKDDVKVAMLLLKNDPNPDVTSRSGFTPLHIAAHYGNVNVGRVLLEKGANVNFVARQNITPLHVASKWGRPEMVALLFSHGAVVDSRTKDSLTPLHCAARSGRDSVVQSLLEKGALICAKTKNGLSPLHMAAQGDHVETTRILGDHRAPLDDVTIDLLTPLHVAAHCGNVKVAKTLLDRGADVNSKALNGFAPLHVACKKNRIKVIELLLKYHASVNASTQTGLTPLHVASFSGHANIVHYLIQQNADVNATTRLLETPLHFAVWGNHAEVVRMLLRSGARVDAIESEFHTPLHLACEQGNEEIAKTLLSNGAKAEAETENRWTPLHMAAKSGKPELIDLLLNERVSPNAETKKGFRPLHLAAKYGHVNAAKLLIDRGGANMDAASKNQLTPLHMASLYNREQMVVYLLERGALPKAAGLEDHGLTPLHIAADKNHLNVAAALLQFGADPNAKTADGYVPLHSASNRGHTDSVSMLLQHNANPNASAENGLTPMHLCAQEDHVQAAHVLLSFGARIDSRTKAGYTPLHVACHFARANMVRFLLRYGARAESNGQHGYTPLHQAAQQGSLEIVELLLDSGASANALTVDGQTPLAIGRRAGYGQQLDALRFATDTRLIAEGARFKEQTFVRFEPETMLEEYDFMEIGREDSGLSGDSSGEKRIHSFEISNSTTGTKSLYRLEDGLESTTSPSSTTKKQQLISTMDPNEQAQLEKLIQIEQQRSNSHQQIHQQQQATSVVVTPPPAMVDSMHEADEGGINYQLDGHYLPDNIEISSVSAHGGFLISFLVDARGGAMRGCRHSGVRIIIPPRKAPMPMRITCRYLRKEKLVHPPPLSEGEALASRILEIGPAGAKFLGPVILEIPHFASLRNREREIMIIRSDDGEHWKEHQLEATEDAVQEVLNESFDPEDLSMLYDPELTLFPTGTSFSELSQLDDLNTTRITRILTNDFPQYFAVVTRIRQEVHAVGPDGGMIGSTVVPQVKAIFPEGALTKTIKVSLQAQPISQELVTKLHGTQVAVSPIVTVEPRRRKFHKPITLCIPLPQSTQKSIFAQYQQQQQQQASTAAAGGAGAGGQGVEKDQKEPPTLRLLCSITGGTSQAKWEDITGTTQLAFSTEHVSFTTTVSARFWLMDCDAPKEAARMAQEIYNESVHVPYMAKFVVFARRTQINEWQLRVFCMTDDREEKTLERQEHYTEIAKSRDVEVSAARQQFVEFSGNIMPVIKMGEQLNLKFVPFQENRLMFSMKKRDSESYDAPATGRIAFVKEAKQRANDLATHQHPICTLAITLPNTANYYSNNLETQSIGSQSSSLSRKYRFSKHNIAEVVHNTDVSLYELARELGADGWEELGRALTIPDDDLRQIKTEYNGQETAAVLRIWMDREGHRATGENLESALRRLGRDDVFKTRLMMAANKRGETALNGDGPTIDLLHHADDESESKKPRM